MAKTKISWCDHVWNALDGCDPLSRGCDNCYAMSIATRFAGTPAFPHGFDVTLHPERMNAPFAIKTPSKIFVASMSDVFHHDVPVDYIAQMFAVMAATPQHTYILLTKRPAPMRAVLRDRAAGLRDTGVDGLPGPDGWPLPNVILGISAEDQDAARKRLPILLDTEAACRAVSAEPLLGPVDLAEAARGRLDRLGWVIVGGESGAKARPMHPAWPRALRDQCVDQSIPYFYKQWGEWAPERLNYWTREDGTPRGARKLIAPDGTTWASPQEAPVPLPANTEVLRRFTNKRNIEELDGRSWTQFPAGLEPGGRTPATPRTPALQAATAL